MAEASSQKDETRNGTSHRNGFGTLNDEHRSLSFFERLRVIWKECWTWTIHDFGFHSDDHFESRNGGLYKCITFPQT